MERYMTKDCSERSYKIPLPKSYHPIFTDIVITFIERYSQIHGHSLMDQREGKEEVEIKVHLQSNGGDSSSAVLIQKDNDIRRGDLKERIALVIRDNIKDAKDKDSIKLKNLLDAL